MGWSRNNGSQSFAEWSRMSDDPIASDPALLWYWSRLVGVLVVLLAIALGATDATTVDLSSLVNP